MSLTIFEFDNIPKDFWAYVYNNYLTLSRYAVWHTSCTYVRVLYYDTFLVNLYRLELLYERDEEKKNNEQAKNALESHIFEMQDFMYTDEVTEVSTEEERTTILSTLKEASDWLYDEGESAETRVCNNLLHTYLCNQFAPKYEFVSTQ